MLYIREIYYRIIIFFFCLMCNIIISYTFRKVLLDIIIMPFLLTNKKFTAYFIYTHPIELTKTILLIVLIFAFICSIPYFFWLAKDFFRTCLNIKEIEKITKVFYICSTGALILNLNFFTFLFPLMWNFLDSFNKGASLNITVLLELKIEEYASFIIDYLIVINTACLFLFIIFLSFLFIGVSTIIQYKNIYVLINILLATMLSSPEILVQLLILLILTLFIELLIFVCLLKTKINKEVN